MRKEIRIAIVGVGNCASSLIQGLWYYNSVSSNKFVPGLIHSLVGRYRVKDIVPVVAFDIDERKINKDISEAIFEKPNVATKFCNVPILNAKVFVGPILDGVSQHMLKFDKDITFLPTKEKPVNVAEKLKEYKVDVVINYLPVGSKEATEYYANAAIQAGCAFVNCMPIFIASNKKWVKKFERAGLPLLGDDVKSQLGATWSHRMAIQSYLDRGIKILHTKQENYGGNTDFLNMTDPERIQTKLISKRSSIEHLIKDHPKGGYSIPPVYAGPGKGMNNHGFIAGQGDKKIAKIIVEGIGFGGIPVNIKIELEVEDSPNSAGIVIDAIRCAKLGLDRGISGVLTSPSSFFFKHPYKKVQDSEAIKKIEKFIKCKTQR